MKNGGGILVPGSIGDASIGVKQKEEIDLVECEKNNIPPVMVGDIVQVNNSSGIKLAAIVVGITESFESDGAIVAMIFGGADRLSQVKIKHGARGWVLKDHKTKRMTERRIMH